MFEVLRATKKDGEEISFREKLGGRRRERGKKRNERLEAGGSWRGIGDAKKE